MYTPAAREDGRRRHVLPRRYNQGKASTGDGNLATSGLSLPLSLAKLLVSCMDNMHGPWGDRVRVDV
jgi:hypothetical protein